MKVAEACKPRAFENVRACALDASISLEAFRPTSFERWFSGCPPIAFYLFMQWFVKNFGLSEVVNK
jgi:hypothetical protein